MNQQLISNGFSYLGKCAACGGKADKYSKMVGNQQAIIKLRPSGIFTLSYQSKVMRGELRNLDYILAKYGLKEQAPVQS